MEQTKIKKYRKWSMIFYGAGLVICSYILIMDFVSYDFLSRGQKNTGQVIAIALLALGAVLFSVSQEKFSLKKILIWVLIVLVGLLAIFALLPYNPDN